MVEGEWDCVRALRAAAAASQVEERVDEDVEPGHKVGEIRRPRSDSDEKTEAGPTSAEVEYTA